MAAVTFKGEPATTVGPLPAVGSKAPALRLCGGDLRDRTLQDDYAGKVRVLNVVPSLDTPVCSRSAQRFEAEASALGPRGAVVLNVSADLPFAAARFCESHRIAHVETLSTFRSPDFGTDWGLRIATGPLAGLMARAVVVVGADDTVLYVQLVAEIANEPDYTAVLEFLRKILPPPQQQ